MEKFKWLSTWKTFIELEFHLDPDVAQFISCQFALESNFGRSDIYRYNNNICGMKLPKFRVTCAQKAERGHAYYNCVEDSIWDYFIWLTYYGFSRKHLSNLTKFVVQLRKCPYCPAPDYIDRILQLKSQYYE